MVKMKAILGVALALLAGLFLCCRGDSTGDSPGEGYLAAAGSLEAETSVSGRIVFQSDLDGDEDIYLLEGRRITKLTDNTWNDRYPRWSPDGRRIAFTADPDGNFDLFVMDDDGARATRLSESPEDEVDVAWFRDGKDIVFSAEFRKMLGRQRSLWRLDLGTKKRSRLLPDFSSSHQLADISPRLPQVAFTGKKGFGWDVFLADLPSQTIEQVTFNGKGCRPRFSPDGRQIAYVSTEADGKGDVWSMRLGDREARRLTIRPDSYDYFPSWSPDGTRIVFCSNFKDKYADKGEWGLYLLDVSDGRVVRLFDSAGRDVFPDWR